MSISAKQVSSWTRIVVSSLVLVGVFLAVGYGLIGIFLLVLLVAMGGGALLYWVDGESER
jgi:hypothetical protein